MKRLNIAFTGFVIIALFFSCGKKKTNYVSVSNPTEDVFTSTKDIPDNHFLGDQKCKECHTSEFKTWEGSHHDKAMQEVSDSTVLGNFDNAKFKSQGVTSHFFKKDKDYYVNTEGPDGKNHDYKVEYVFGIKPLQQYIVKFPNGHYQCLRTAWDTEKKKWFDLYPDFKVVHSEWLHWSRGGLNWNTMCSDCHSTNVRKNYDKASHSYDTKYTLINVSCEACHGPGKTHVERVNTLGEGYKVSDDLKMTVGTDSKDLVDQCARCHMRREHITSSFNFEGTMLDHYFPQLLEQNLYHADGQILDEVYVYGSFVQSKMYHNGVACTDCHNPHSLELKFKGNNLCAQCHVPETYDTPSHHFHEKGTQSAQCINCHMTGKHYMGNDFRRDHSFRIPRPDLSLKYGTPNACTQCHEDKDDAWASEQFEKLYGKPKNKHFSELLAPGMAGTENGLDALLELAHDTIYPEIARASAVKNMSNYITPANINTLISFLDDDSPLVRGATLDVLGGTESKDYLNYYMPLLKDKKRTVRIKAFFALASLDEIQIPEAYKEAYKKVEKEFNTSLIATSDFVGGRIKEANYHLKKGNLAAAIAGYESALEIDNINNMARTNLANLYYRNGDFKKAEDAFKTIIEQEPEFGQTYYSYALLLGEQNRHEEAITQMELAIKYVPDNIRFYYNLSLLYDKANNFKKAEETAIKGLKIAPQNDNLLYVLAYIYSKTNQLQKAINISENLVNLYPNNQSYVNFYNQLRVQLNQTQ
ncbi:tetratricopeptide repeat protein [Tamlana sp. 2201CG12-4]|uniref:tetratricopeptide repeat protein n=1 Tax=Tamlana sp. 2201CG12-4 TaxID=3112582 RepID=UPI002DB93248|nr:tetratricopeptide repeat protein [Tamlana sp. 2201CG12-4]MEC3907626.1 tetratricopeptide repeat protein [Tamlana sp. 2201CG12-4]